MWYKNSRSKTCLNFMPFGKIVTSMILDTNKPFLQTFGKIELKIFTIKTIFFYDKHTLLWSFLADVNSRSRSLLAIAIPSVVCRLSVTLRWCTLLRRLNFSAIFFSPYDSPGTLLFWCQKSLVGDAPFALKFAFKVTHTPFKQRNFDQYRLIAPQPW